MKNNLNGHYCLATKEHYEQLVKDGYEPFEDADWACTANELYFIYNNSFTADKKYIGPWHKESMHYHNNQWVFGTLEHEEECPAKERALGFIKDAFESKPPKRITLEGYLMGILKDISETATLPGSYIEGFTDCISYIEGYKND